MVWKSFVYLVIAALTANIVSCLPRDWYANFDSTKASYNRFEDTLADGISVRIVNYSYPPELYGQYAIRLIFSFKHRNELMELDFRPSFVDLYFNGREMTQESIRELPTDNPNRMRAYELRYSVDVTESDYVSYIQGLEDKPVARIDLTLDSSLVVSGDLVEISNLSAYDVLEDGYVWLRENRSNGQ